MSVDRDKNVCSKRYIPSVQTIAPRVQRPAPLLLLLLLPVSSYLFSSIDEWSRDSAFFFKVGPTRK
jgi:hypothetical protein